jgi:hypothetical protein
MDSPESEGTSLGPVAETNSPIFWWCVTVLRPRIDPALAVFLLARHPFHETCNLSGRVKFGRQLRPSAFSGSARPARLVSPLDLSSCVLVLPLLLTPSLASLVLVLHSGTARLRFAMQFPAQDQPQTKLAQRDPYSTVSSL